MLFFVWQRVMINTVMNYSNVPWGLEVYILYCEIKYIINIICMQNGFPFLFNGFIFICYYGNRYSNDISIYIYIYISLFIYVK